MAPIFVSFAVSFEAMEQYSELPISSNWRLLQHLESVITVCVDEVDSEDQYYLCCFADCSGRPCNTRELLAIPLSHASDQLRNLIPLGNLAQGNVLS